MWRNAELERFRKQLRVCVCACVRLNQQLTRGAVIGRREGVFREVKGHLQ